MPDLTMTDLQGIALAAGRLAMGLVLLAVGYCWGRWAERRETNRRLASTQADLAAAQVVCEGLADRVAAQSELLSKRAEKP